MRLTLEGTLYSHFPFVFSNGCYELHNPDAQRMSLSDFEDDFSLIESDL